MFYCCANAARASHRVIVCDYDEYSRLKDNIVAYFDYNKAGSTNTFNSIFKVSNLAVHERSGSTRKPAIIMPVDKHVLILHQQFDDTGTKYQAIVFGPDSNNHNYLKYKDMLSNLVKVSGVYVGDNLPQIDIPDLQYKSASLIWQQRLFDVVSERVYQICNVYPMPKWIVKLGVSTSHLNLEEYMRTRRERYGLNTRLMPPKHSYPLVILDACTFHLAMKDKCTIEDILQDSFASNAQKDDMLTSLIHGIPSACSIVVPLFDNNYRPLYLLIRQEGAQKTGVIMFAEKEPIIDNQYCFTVWNTVKKVLDYVLEKGQRSQSLDVLVADTLAKYKSAGKSVGRNRLDLSVYRRMHARMLDDCLKDELAWLMLNNRLAKLDGSNFIFKHYMTD